MKLINPKIVGAFLLNTVFLSGIQAQISDDESDKCGTPQSSPFVEQSILSTSDWGYGTDELNDDLFYWQQSTFVEIENIGFSTLGREIYVLNIKDENSFPEYRINIHARTHPNEFQGWNVTDEIISILISESDLQKRLLSKCVFSIIPMYNPDGVELNYARENANMVDLESNWGSAYPEKEVENLRNYFTSLMESELPINIMLNMHSAYQCNRYFVYHHQNGTSTAFAEDERRFITAIKNHFNEGIKAWDHYISWTGGTPNKYPESWFWNNFGESVMALTYEDMNCSSAGEYNKTAVAMLSGIADYLELPEASLADEDPIALEKLKIYPNPVNEGDIVNLNTKNVFNNTVSVSLFNMTGQEIILKSENIIEKSNNVIQILTSGIESGTYLIRVTDGNRMMNSPLIIR